MPTVDTDQLIAELTRTTGTAGPRLPGLTRAAEHLVLNLDATSAATPHGTYAVGGAPVPPALDALVAQRVAVLLGRLPAVLVTGAVSGGLGYGYLFDVPDDLAAPQGGQKTEAHSRAFNITPDLTPTVIDASAYLNVSMQLGSLAGVVTAMLKLAVVAEAEAQIVAALEAVTTTPGGDLGSALGAFTGVMFNPKLVIVPTGMVMDVAQSIAGLTALGITVAVVPSATTVSVVDPAGISGFLVDSNVSADEPSVLGRTVASQLWGQLSISPAAVSSSTAV